MSDYHKLFTPNYLGYNKMQGRTPWIWTEPMLKFIKDNAATMSDLQIAMQLSELTGQKISSNTIRVQRSKMGIKKGKGIGSKVVDWNNVNYLTKNRKRNPPN